MGHCHYRPSKCRKMSFGHRIVGTQSGGAIVTDESGITLDRTYRAAEFLGQCFQVVDTGGLVFDDDDSDVLFAEEIHKQAMAGVVLDVDGQVGPTAMDLQLAEFPWKDVTKNIPVLLD